MLLQTPPELIGEKRLIFQDLDWQAFKQIQQLFTNRTHARFTYGEGVLEITMPLEDHEPSSPSTRSIYEELGKPITRRDGV